MSPLPVVRLELYQTAFTHTDVAFFCPLLVIIHRRTQNRRGCLKYSYSDNGTNFVSGKKEMREVVSQWNREKLIVFMTQREITWKFNLPSAPHFDGSWERLIQSAKS